MARAAKSAKGGGLLAAALIAAGAALAAWLAPGSPAEAGPPVPRVRFLLGDAKGEPGATVTLDVDVETNVPLREISIAIDFDETVLSLLKAGRAPGEGAVPKQETTTTRVDNADAADGDQNTEGWVHVELGTLGVESLGVATGQRTTVFQLVFLISEDAKPGVTAVRFATIGPVDVDGQQVLLENSAVVDVEGALQDAPLSPEDLEMGAVTIIGEVGFFQRGDVDLNCRHEMSDALATLMFLFLGGSEPPCLDAADANDSGDLDLSDPVYTLEWLYNGGTSYGQPFPAIGTDPTPDGLDCAEGLPGVDACGAS